MPLWGLTQFASPRIDPTNHDVLYVATNTSGVWQSPDAGASWQPTGVLPGVPYSVVVDPSPAHTIFAGTSGGVWKSSDSGSWWHDLRALPTLRLAHVGASLLRWCEAPIDEGFLQIQIAFVVESLGEDLENARSTPARTHC